MPWHCVRAGRRSSKSHGWKSTAADNLKRPFALREWWWRGGGRLCFKPLLDAFWRVISWDFWSHLAALLILPSLSTLMTLRHFLNAFVKLMTLDFSTLNDSGFFFKFSLIFLRFFIFHYWQIQKTPGVNDFAFFFKSKLFATLFFKKHTTKIQSARIYKIFYMKKTAQRTRQTSLMSSVVHYRACRTSERVERPRTFWKGKKEKIDSKKENTKDWKKRANDFIECDNLSIGLASRAL